MLCVGRLDFDIWLVARLDWAGLYEEGDGYLYCDTPGCHPGCDGHKHVVMIGSRGLVQDNYYLMDGEEGESEGELSLTSPVRLPHYSNRCCHLSKLES